MVSFRIFYKIRKLFQDFSFQVLELQSRVLNNLKVVCLYFGHFVHKQIYKNLEILGVGLLAFVLQKICSLPYKTVVICNYSCFVPLCSGCIWIARKRGLVAAKVVLGLLKVVRT
jgi:hypothetical protein